MNRRNVFIVGGSMGCVLNQNHLQRLHTYFDINQWSRTEELEKADLVVFCGCGVVSSAEREVIHNVQYIEDYLKKKGLEKPIAVTGCVAKINQKTGTTVKGKTLSHSKKTFSAGPKDMDKLDAHIGATTPFNSVPYPNDHSYSAMIDSFRKSTRSISNPATRIRSLLLMHGVILLGILEHGFGKDVSRVSMPHELVSRYGYKLLIPGMGCKYNCNYCAIKFAKGSPKSRKLSDVVNEFKRLLAQGEKKILLYADDIGSWGVDIGSDWTTLVRELVSIKGDFKLAIHNLHSNDFVKGEALFNDILPTGKISFIGVMLQHVDESILKKMNRPTLNFTAFSRLWNKLGSSGITLNTHLMVGFPGEGENEFKRLESFIAESQTTNFTLMAWAYNRREGTVAAEKYADLEIPTPVIYSRISSINDLYGKKVNAPFIRTKLKKWKNILLTNVVETMDGFYRQVK